MTDPGDGPLPLDEIPSPYVLEFGDYRNKMIRLTINWDTSNGDLMSGVAYRDPECVYTKIYIGFGDDGTVDNTPDQWTIPAGETLVRANILKKARMRTIRDVMAVQVTAGP